MAKLRPTEPDPAVLDIYRERLDRYGATKEAMGWYDNKLALRYKALTRHIPLAARVQVLDFGCGVGFLRDWLKKNRPAAVYVGIDPCKEMIQQANSRTREALFSHLDDLDELGTQFDHIVCCGIFTQVGDRGKREQENHVVETLFKLCESARVSVSVDFLDASVCDAPEEGLYYADPSSVVRFRRRATIDRSYLPFEFCAHFFTASEIDHMTNRYMQVVL